MGSCYAVLLKYIETIVLDSLYHTGEPSLLLFACMCLYKVFCCGGGFFGGVCDLLL